MIEIGGGEYENRKLYRGGMASYGVKTKKAIDLESEWETNMQIFYLS